MNRLWFDKYHLTTNLVIEETIKRGKKRVDKEKKRVDKEKKRGRRRGWIRRRRGVEEEGGGLGLGGKEEKEGERTHAHQRRKKKQKQSTNRKDAPFSTPRNARPEENGVRVRIKCPHPGAGTRLEVRPRFDPR